MILEFHYNYNYFSYKHYHINDSGNNIRKTLIIWLAKYVISHFLNFRFIFNRLYWDALTNMRIYIVECLSVIVLIWKFLWFNRALTNSELSLQLLIPVLHNCQSWRTKLYLIYLGNGVPHILSWLNWVKWVIYFSYTNF